MTIINGKLVRLENSLRYLRAENVRLPDSKQHQPQLEQLKRRNAHSSRFRGRAFEVSINARRVETRLRKSVELATSPENGRQLEEKEREDLERFVDTTRGLQYMTRSNSGEKDAMERMLQTEFFSDASTEDRLKRLTTDIQAG
uniref:Uncharacterized protein n=1 Tax=Macrostomum lignano TaxID=282301 RepID=A0A1I8F8Y1_9PLAT